MNRTTTLVGATALASLALLDAAPGQAAEPCPEPTTLTDQASGVSETVWPNGFRLLVKPQPDNPMVTTMLWYAVGSRDEGVGETGLSHYLEHMLFKGTTKLPVGAIDQLTQRNGGANNASTREDATEYHFTFPADRWEVALEIEADRMRNSRVEAKEFESEKLVVLNELYIGLDDPSDVLFTAVGSAAFPVGRYHHPIIGWKEDVETTTRERMMQYYLKHYTPDRATLVVVGGVDRDRAIRRVGELFGPLPRGDVARFEQKEPPPLGETRLTLIQDTQVPRLVMAFRSLPTLDPKEPLLDVASEILAGDKSSRLERALVTTGLATAASCWNDSRRDAGLFGILVQPAEGHTLAEVEAATRRVLAEFAEQGPTQDEVRLAQAKILAQRVFEQESSTGLASRLGSVAVLGDWRYALRYPDAIAAATPAAIRDAVRPVLDLTKATIGLSVPKDGGGGGGGAKADDGDETGGGEGDEDARRRRHRSSEKGARSARWREGGTAVAPGAAPASEGVVDRALTFAPTRRVLENGLTVLALRRTQAPLVNIRLFIDDGRLGEAVPGLDALTGGLLDEGTRRRSAAQLAEAIGAVGGSLAAGPGGVSAKVLSKDAALALDLVAEVATEPAFEPEALERARRRQLSSIAEELDTPRSVAQLEFAKAVYGPNHPMGRSGLGTPDLVRGLTREQVLAHHATFWSPKNATLAVVSDLEPAVILALAEKAFGGWTGGAKPRVEPPAPPAPAAATVKVPLARAQANVFLGHLGIRRTDPDFLALEVLDNVFGTGSGFTDRLSKTVRDVNGLAYSVFGNVTASASTQPGAFRMYAGTQPSDAPKAIDLMRQELAALLTDRPPTAEELVGAKAALRGGMIASCETSDGILGVLRLCERYGLGFDYPHRYLHDLEAVTPEQVLAAARAHLRPDALIEVVVGP